MKTDPTRKKKQEEAFQFVMDLVNAPIDKICVENSIGHISSAYRKPDQIIHPWMFGHSAAKGTCLWLKNLPKLESTHIILASYYTNGSPRWDNQTPTGADKTAPGKDRWKVRSRTYEGIAKAMADQWG